MEIEECLYIHMYVTIHIKSGHTCVLSFAYLPAQCMPVFSVSSYVHTTAWTLALSILVPEGCILEPCLQLYYSGFNEIIGFFESVYFNDLV